MSNEYVYHQNIETGEIHRGIHDGRRLFVNEACNRDDALHLEGIEEAEVAERLAMGGSQCGHCFPEPESESGSITFLGDAGETTTDVSGD